MPDSRWVHCGLRRSVYFQTRMLHDLGNRSSGLSDGAAPGAANMGVAAATTAQDLLRLLIVHHGDARLAALEDVLTDLGYSAMVAATADEALAAIARGPLPDVLLTTRAPCSPRRGAVFPTECLARWPTLHTLYVSFVPRTFPDLPRGREIVLAAPFNAEQLAAALAQLRPAHAAER